MTPSRRLSGLDGLIVLSKHLTTTILFNDLLQEILNVIIHKPIKIDFNGFLIKK